MELCPMRTVDRFQCEPNAFALSDLLGATLHARVSPACSGGFFAPQSLQVFICLLLSGVI